MVKAKVYFKLPEEAFKNAIAKGMSNPEDFMYMYSKDGLDYFKHKDTREYISFGGVL